MTLDDVYDDLLVIVSHAGAQIDVPLESEQFFESLLDNFDGSKDEFIAFARVHVKNWFRSVLNKPPNWLQEAEWQFHNGVPMIFLGEIPIDRHAGLYHDDACVFTFVSPDGVTKSVIQIA